MAQDLCSTAQLFEASALRFAKAFGNSVAANQRMWSRPSRVQARRSPLPVAHLSVEMTSATEAARLTDSALHDAVRIVTESLDAQARDAAAARGIKISVHRIAQGERNSVPTPSTEVFLAQLEDLDAAVGAHDAAMNRVLELRSAMPGPAPSAYRQALGTFEQHREWEGLNFCLAEMASAAASGIEAMYNEAERDSYGCEANAEVIQAQGAPAVALEGRWNGELFRLIHFCAAALHAAGWMQLKEVQGEHAFGAISDKSETMLKAALEDRALTLREQLVKAKALAPLQEGVLEYPLGARFERPRPALYALQDEASTQPVIPKQYARVERSSRVLDDSAMSL